MLLDASTSLRFRQHELVAVLRVFDVWSQEEVTLYLEDIIARGYAPSFDFSLILDCLAHSPYSKRILNVIPIFVSGKKRLVA